MLALEGPGMFRKLALMMKKLQDALDIANMCWRSGGQLVKIRGSLCYVVAVRGCSSGQG